MKIIALLIIIFFGISVCAKEHVLFIPEKPFIDGVIERDFENKLKKFTDVYKSNKELQEVPVKYFLGYSSDFLYIYIEAEAEKIIHRDRGYQNGDGFHLTIAKSNTNGSETDEFYVFGFSPTKDWSNKMRWYYNIDLSMASLPENVLFESIEQKNKISFELLLPWTVANPYHPWINDNIGFNLCFIKAVNENDKIYYFIKADEKMQSEQSKRKYVNLSFEPPTNEGKIFTMPVRHNISKNQSIDIYFTGYFNNRTNLPVNVTILDDTEKNMYSEELNLKFQKGLSKITNSLKETYLESGNYYIQIYCKEELIGNHYITVLENIDFNTIRSYLVENKSKIKPGTYNTVQFYLNDLENEIHILKYYESSKNIAQKTENIHNFISDIKSQKDPFEKLKGVYRRAFLSKIDNTYRPYSMYLPENFSPEKQYPLLVYLHGSGEDDRALAKANFMKEKFIVLAPNGRGTSNCFATKEAQIDIKEAIDDVIANFNINTRNIILSGFSMGGYGVYRTYYEYPEIFSALAIISGHPNLATKWRVENGINFLDEDLLKLFSPIPIYIYHGKKDLNCPYELTVKLVDILKKYNNNIIFRIDENVGHGMMNEDIQEDYFNWLKEHI